jgi:hypothetical protein
MAMETLMGQAESILDSAEPDTLLTLARHQAALLDKLKGRPVAPEHTAALAHAMERSRQLALRIEGEMNSIRSLLTASANKKRISGAYAAPY